MTVRDSVSALLVAAAFVSSWNAVAVAGIQPVDLLLAGAFALSALYLAGGEIPWVPGWARAGTACVLVVIVTHVLFPMGEAYMSRRFIYVPFFVTPGAQGAVENGAVRGLKWLLAALLLPVLVAETARGKPEVLSRIANAWLAGIGVSALVAVTDLLDITSINLALIVLGGASERQAGLALHPNHLGLAVALAVPLAIRLTLRSRVKGVLVLLILGAGAIVSGSRQGQAAFALATIATLAWTARALRIVPVLMLALGISVTAIIGLRPDLVAKTESFFRFGSASRSVMQSNEERSALAEQAISDFSQRPLDGIGLEVIAQAHNIYLQLVASGGLILAAGILYYFAGVLAAGYAERNSPDPLGACLMITVLVWLAAGAFGNQLTDRYLYFPVAVLAGLELSRVRAARHARQVRLASRPISVNA